MYYGLLLAAMNNQMPIKEGVGANNGYRQQVGNNNSSNTVPSSSAMNHLLLGKKPLVNSKPRRGPHPGAIPPEFRRPMKNGAPPSMTTKKPSVHPVVSSVSEQTSFKKVAKDESIKRTISEESNPTIHAEASIKDTRKAAAAMSVTQVACPQVKI